MKCFCGYRSLFFRKAFAALFVLLPAGLLVAASPTFWHVSTQSELLQGELEHLSVDESGQITSRQKQALSTNRQHRLFGQ